MLLFSFLDRPCGVSMFHADSWSFYEQTEHQVLASDDLAHCQTKIDLAQNHSSCPRRYQSHCQLGLKDRPQRTSRLDSSLP